MEATQASVPARIREKRPRKYIFEPWTMTMTINLYDPLCRKHHSGVFTVCR